MRLGGAADERPGYRDPADGGGRQPADPARRRAGAAGGADRPDRGRAGIAPHPLLYLGRRRGRAGGCATLWWRRPSAASRCRCWSTASAPRRAEGFFQPLVEAEARFCRFVPRWGRRYLLRNHQKLALADGRKAIVGGFNISNDYFGTIEAGAWRDLGLAGRRAERRTAWSAISTPCSTGPRLPDASIRRLQADAEPAQRPRRRAALAVRRADPAAQPLGAVGQGRHDAGRRGST